ncbi:uncharacterized protein LOC134670857 [Cydia fagiglandana]|uniref:uncharacterized protein LOC134670857 n=1 Tax=Cydia fagiglandana TaxID=1458189 RepID=UPI002FEE0A9E
MPRVYLFSDPANVFSLNYMKTLRFWLNSIASWPHKVSGGSNITTNISTIYRCMLIMLLVMNICTTITYWKKHVDTDFGQMYLNVMLSAICIQRLFLPFQEKYCSVVNKFILDFHLIHHRHDADSIQVYDRINKMCTIVSVASRSQTFVALILYNMVPLYKSYKAGMFSEHRPQNATFQHAVDYEIPLNQYTLYRDYIIIFIYNWYASYNVAICICMYDLLIFTIVFHIWGHLNILIHDLKYFVRPSLQCFENNYSVPATQEDMASRLKDIIKRHQKIKEFMSRTSEAFSTPLCCYLLFNQLSGCVMLLKCSSLDPMDLWRYGLMTVIIFQQLIETSVIFELVRSKGDILPDKVYELPWVCMDIRNRRIFLMFLNNVQTPLAIKAGGILPVGVMTMSMILRNSCSYFIMLRTFTQS